METFDLGDLDITNVDINFEEIEGTATKLLLHKHVPDSNNIILMSKYRLPSSKGSSFEGMHIHIKYSYILISFHISLGCGFTPILNAN
jgi:hypothetical protein